MRDTNDVRPHQIKWDDEEWEQIEKATKEYGRRQHLDLNPTDFIRAGTRRLIEEVLGKAKR